MHKYKINRRNTNMKINNSINKDINSASKKLWLSRYVIIDLLKDYCFSEILRWDFINWEFIAPNFNEILIEKHLAWSKWILES